MNTKLITARPHPKYKVGLWVFVSHGISSGYALIKDIAYSRKGMPVCYLTESEGSEARWVPLKALSVLYKDQFPGKE